MSSFQEIECENHLKELPTVQIKINKCDTLRALKIFKRQIMGQTGLFRMIVLISDFNDL